MRVGISTKSRAVCLPDLVCHAIEWLLSRVKSGGELGIRVGQSSFVELDYADEGALPPSVRASSAAFLPRFSEEVGHLGLHV